MKKILLTTISMMACFTVQAQNVSEGDIEKYLQAHPEAIERYMDNKQKPTPKGNFMEGLKSAPASVVDEITHNPNFYSLGNPQGKFVIIEFFDYQCGWCKRSHKALSEMLESEKAKDIRIIPVATPIFGAGSELIAKYVLAAGKQGKFKEMHHAVMTAGRHLDEGGLLDLAKGLGLNTTRLAKEAEGDEIARVLETANGYRTKMRVSGVPMFIVNGKVQSGAILDDKAQEILAAQGTMPIYGGSDDIKAADNPTRTYPKPNNFNEPQPMEPASTIAPDIMGVIKEARARGIIKPDGRLEINENGGKLSGKLLCSDSEIEKNLEAWDTEVNLANPDEEKMRQHLDGALRCISISDFEFEDSDSSIKFTGNYKFPVFADNSKGTIKANDKVIDISFKLAGNNQTANIIVRSKAGAKLADISVQYDAERMAIPFEWGMSGQLMDYMTRSGVSKHSNDRMIRQLQIWAQENELLTDGVFKINKAEIYQPDGKKVLILKGDDKDKSILRIFNSVEREFFNALWTDKDLKVKLSFPQSGGRILESETKFSPNFKENYKKFSAEYQKQVLKKGRPSVRLEASVEQMMQLFAGLKEEATLYGLDGQQLARLKIKLNDTITSTKRPENVIDYATVSILKPSMNCQVRSVTFSKVSPDEMTVCDSNGCTQQPAYTAVSKLQPCLEDDMDVLSKKFGEEIKDEMSKLENVYIPGVSDGYNMGMSRYRANEILNAAAMVAIVAASANGGMGNKADLSDLGGYQSMKLDGIAPFDSAIRSTPEGVVTIEFDPKTAKDIMPTIKELSGKRVVSDCTPDTNTCVLDMRISVK
ncbi:MAG: DsbA family protein [Alphaproteobacteria bacterium]|nr:DsbA family protein [Alphaproteobacteria bacterium]